MDKNNVLIGGFGIILGLTVGFSIFSPSSMTGEMDMSGGDMKSHPHGIVEIDYIYPIPEISIEAIKDEKGGFNILVTTNNYTFTPEKINQEPVANEGHAHVFVNGKKINRLYGEWYYLSEDKFVDGDNVIEVTLNANEHSDWGRDGQHISDKVKVVK